MRCKQASPWIFVSLRGPLSVGGRVVLLISGWLYACACREDLPSTYWHVLVQTAPSQVSEVIKEKVQQRSIQLSWQEPHQPNGVITEYEIKYYEKVSLQWICLCLCLFLQLFPFHLPHHIHFCRFFILYSIGMLLWVEFTRFCKYLLCLIIAIMNEMLIRF